MGQIRSPMVARRWAHTSCRPNVAGRVAGDPTTPESPPYPEIAVLGAPVPDVPMPGQPPFPETPVPGAPPSPLPAIPTAPDEPTHEPTQPEMPPAPDLPGVPPLPGQLPEPETPRYHRRIPSRERAAYDGRRRAS